MLFVMVAKEGTFGPCLQEQEAAHSGVSLSSKITSSNWNTSY